VTIKRIKKRGRSLAILWLSFSKVVSKDYEEENDRTNEPLITSRSG